MPVCTPPFNEHPRDHPNLSSASLRCYHLEQRILTLSQTYKKQCSITNSSPTAQIGDKHPFIFKRKTKKHRVLRQDVPASADSAASADPLSLSRDPWSFLLCRLPERRCRCSTCSFRPSCHPCWTTLMLLCSACAPDTGALWDLPLRHWRSRHLRCAQMPPAAQQTGWTTCTSALSPEPTSLLS